MLCIRSPYLFRLRQESDFHLPSVVVGSAHIVKVGIGLGDDIRALKVVYSLEDRNMLDLGTVANVAVWHKPACEISLGFS